MRLIDAHVLSAQYKVEYDHADAMGNAHRKKGWQGALQLLYDAPTIDPESLRPKGRWEKYWCETDLIGHMYEVCPNCQSCEILDTDKFWDSNYCPNCGAKMEG